MQGVYFFGGFLLLIVAMTMAVLAIAKRIEKRKKDRAENKRAADRALAADSDAIREYYRAAGPIELGALDIERARLIADERYRKGRYAQSRAKQQEDGESPDPSPDSGCCGSSSSDCGASSSGGDS